MMVKASNKNCLGCLSLKAPWSLAARCAKVIQRQRVPRQQKFDLVAQENLSHVRPAIFIGL